MSFFGLTPSEHTSGDKRVQGGITKSGNAHCRRVLTEAAWHYRLKPQVSEAMQKRQEDQSKASPAHRLEGATAIAQPLPATGRRKKSVVAVTAIARELVGFVWAIACQVKAPEQPAAPEIIRTCRGKVYLLEADKKMQKAK